MSSDMRVMDASHLRARSLLLFLGYLLQAVMGTTVIPLCEPGEMENCTTALIQTENSPRVAQVGITRCKPEMKDYCFHGQCVYIVDLDEHYCRCDVGFSGVRCVHSELVRQPLSTEYVALTVILILLFLIAISIASYYICRRNVLIPCNLSKLGNNLLELRMEDVVQYQRSSSCSPIPAPAFI
ncbi:proepiregulin isoform X3 [Anser cygnoides]|uniref:proepiregulin isoform X3 n=1 Tax=Anser cygnoides TaxID=8845 RepID=UPI0034D2F3F3